MHPILSQRRRLALYLLAWIPIGGLLYYLLTTGGGVQRTQAIGPTILLTVIYAFVCLSAFFSCKATPLDKSSFVRLASTHLIAAALISFLWLALFTGIGYLISPADIYQAVSRRMEQFAWVIWEFGVLLYLLSVALHYVLLALEASRKAEQLEMKARVLARDAELRALKAQINPHFLFNSLHSISALTSIDAKKAREMCITLADFLRMTLGLGEKSVIPLREELALVRSYLSVEKIRFGARLNVTEQIDETVLDFVAPPLLLQPLVENAVGHGIANLPEGGWLRILVQREAGGDGIHIEISNNFDPDSPSRRRSGVGLVNVRQRLETRFSNKATMTVEKGATTFRVNMIFPAEKEHRS